MQADGGLLGNHHVPHNLPAPTPGSPGNAVQFCLGIKTYNILKPWLRGAKHNMGNAAGQRMKAFQPPTSKTDVNRSGVQELMLDAKLAPVLSDVELYRCR